METAQNASEPHSNHVLIADIVALHRVLGRMTTLVILDIIEADHFEDAALMMDCVKSIAEFCARANSSLTWIDSGEVAEEKRQIKSAFDELMKQRTKLAKNLVDATLLDPAGQRVPFKQLEGERAELLRDLKDLAKCLGRKIGDLKPKLLWKLPVHFVDGRSNRGEVQKLAILELDMTGYSTMVEALADAEDTQEAVERINQLITKAVNDTLCRQGLQPENHVISFMGDGALLTFPDVAQAHYFASEFLSYFAPDNKQIKASNLQGLQKHFRIGISFGEVVRKQVLTKEGVAHGYSIAGVPIIQAVRLESNAQLDGILMHEVAWATLPDGLKVEYGPPRNITVKHDVKIPARHWIKKKKGRGKGLPKPPI